MTATHDLILCTRNRPADLATCLTSLIDQRAPADHVLIVDASDDLEAAEVQAVVDGHPDLPIELIRAQPGLPAQRNLGVHRSTAAIVHFLDDDTVLEPGYFAAILEQFAADDRPLSDPLAVLGVGGLPTDLPPPRAAGLQGRLAPGSVRPGAVLPSGRGVLASGLIEPTEVDWLSGCAMSFRRPVLLAEPFDEGLEGYALGEDLELTYRVRQHGRLIVDPAARLEHRESPRNRWDRQRWARTDVVNRRRRVASGTGAYRVRAFWLDGLAQLGLWSVRAIRPGATDARSMAKGMAAGLWAARSVLSAAPRPGPWPPADQPRA
ncbi:glycosyltransferase family 2 protein [Aquihabitans sp. McL0605]|uniref:glycosyltransferase family 2 protein n=1 Tax=Aquihabitans sp. McL0605 TaxID=3415671 RepID=UPI003CE8200D